jgi:hypothetical protein
MWGIKRSLLDYVSQLPDVLITSANDPEVDASSGFSFTLDSIHQLQDEGWEGRYRGSVIIDAYGGMLHVELHDPIVHVSDASSTVSARTSIVDKTLVRILELKLPEVAIAGELAVWNGAPATLTADGADWLGDHYFPGQEVDPISFSAPASILRRR